MMSRTKLSGDPRKPNNLKNFLCCLIVSLILTYRKQTFKKTSGTYMIITYNDVVGSSGHGMNTNTGKFTAPKAGIYQFIIQVYKVSNFLFLHEKYPQTWNSITGIKISYTALTAFLTICSGIFFFFENLRNQYIKLHKWKFPIGSYIPILSVNE